MSDKKHADVLEKISTGIEGFDDITVGGLPLRRTTLLMGGPGCGKTVLALQMLVSGAKQHRTPGIFVAFEENARQVSANAGAFGWDMPELEKKHLFFVDACMRSDVVKSGAFDLTGLLAGLEAKARAMGAKVIVFDAIDVLLSLLADPAATNRRRFWGLAFSHSSTMKIWGKSIPHFSTSSRDSGRTPRLDSATWLPMAPIATSRPPWADWAIASRKAWSSACGHHQAIARRISFVAAREQHQTRNTPAPLLPDSITTVRLHIAKPPPLIIALL